MSYSLCKCLTCYHFCFIVDMVKRLGVLVVWNGVWDVDEGRHKYTGDQQKTAFFPVMKGTTVEVLKEEVCSRMEGDYDSNRKIMLHFFHSMTDADMFPPTMIDKDRQLTDMFEFYPPGTTVRIYVSLGESIVVENLQDVDCDHADNQLCSMTDPNGPPYCSEDYFRDYQFTEPIGRDNDLSVMSIQAVEPTGIEEAVGNEIEEVDNSDHYALATETRDHPYYEPARGVVCTYQRPDGLVLTKGSMFNHADKLIDLVRKAAVKNQWHFTVDRREATRLVLKCKDPNCQWHVGAFKKKEAANYVVKKIESIHTCTARTIDFRHRNVTRTVVARDLLDRFDDPKTIPSNADVIAHAKTLGTEFSYWTAWSTIQKGKLLVSGSRAQNYADLASLFWLTAQANPGTDWAIKANEHTNVFEYCFLAIGAQVAGFKYMRPMLVIDCAHLKKEPVQLVVCTAVDSEQHCYPVAWGLVDSECNNAWNWFLRKLLTHVPDDKHLTFLSDRHRSIINAVATVYPLAEHIHCYIHLKRNMEGHYRTNKWHEHYHQAAYAFNKEECDQLLRDMEIECPRPNSTNGLTVAGYLRQVGLQYWARPYSKNARFEQLCSNHAESLNSCFLKAREMKPVQLFEYMVHKMNIWARKRKLEGERMGRITLTVRREAHMFEKLTEALCTRVVAISDYEYAVMSDGRRFIVNFKVFTCTCGEYQQMLFPCKHAVACASEIRKLGRTREGNDLGVMYNMTSAYYTMEYWIKAYAHTVYMPPPQRTWDRSSIPAEIRAIAPIPPYKEVTPGRDQEKRFKSFPETMFGKRGKYKCSNCKKEGHTKKTCTEPPN